MTKSITVVFFTFLVTLAAHAEGPLPVIPTADQQRLLASNDAKLSANKRLAYDFFRVILIGRHLDQASKFMRNDYIQHNPNVDTGLDGFLKYFSKLGGPVAIPDRVADLVAIQAEGDFVTMSFVNVLSDPSNGAKKYTTTWFDMFRIRNGKIAEHWDCDTKSVSAQ